MVSWVDNKIMYWGTNKVSDHARSELNVSFEPIENKRRMANGTLRKYVVANKRTWSTSWEWLPSHEHETAGTVDGGMSGKQMLTFYKNNLDKAFTLTLRDGAGNTETATVMISEFSYDVVKRGKHTDYWNVDVTIEEV